MSDRKPIYCLRNLILLFALLFGSLVVWQVVFALKAKPGSAVDYHAEVQRLLDERSPQPEGSVNGWPELVAACDAYQRVEDDWQHEGGEGRPEFEFPALTTERIDAPAALPFFLERLEAEGAPVHLDALVEAGWARRPPASGSVIMIELPDLRWARGLAQVEAAAMVMDFASGDGDPGVRRFERMLGLSRTYMQSAFLIEHLVGHAIYGLALRHVRHFLCARDLPDETLAALDALLAQGLAGEAATALDGERLMFMDFVQRTHSDSGNGDGRFLLSEFQNMSGDLGIGQSMGSGLGRWANLSHLFFPSKKQTTETANELYDAWIASSRQTPVERRANTLISDAEVEQRIMKNFVLRTMMPAVGRFVNTYDEVEARRRATRLMIAVERHRVREGALPTSLDDLTPAYLEEVPVDPMTGQAFGYRLLEEGEVLFGCRGYVLYAWGGDLVDNGGAVKTTIELDDAGEDREVPSQGRGLSEAVAGFDYVFNLGTGWE